MLFFFVLFLDMERCLPSTRCTGYSKSVVPNSLLGEILSVSEIWTIYSEVHKYIHLLFDSFDISCQSDSTLEISSASDNKDVVCNANKPVYGIKSSDKWLIIKFSFERKADYLIEGFTSRYKLQSKQYTSSVLLDEEHQGIRASL